MNQILNQDEVDALLHAVSDGSIETDSPKEEARHSAGDTLDLTATTRFVRGRMPTLEMIHENFTRNYRTTLAATLRQEVEMSISSISTVKFGDFLGKIPVPGCLNIIKTDPLRKMGLFVIEAGFVFYLIEKLTGGTGKNHTKIEGKEFTQIELRMLRKLITEALKLLTKAWQPVYEVNFQFVRTEMNPQFVSIVSHQDVVLDISFELDMGDATGKIDLVIPYASIEPIKWILHSSVQNDELEVDQDWTRRLTQRLLGAQVRVQADLGQTSLSAEQIRSLKVGDILQLSSNITSEVPIKIEGISKFLGTPVHVEGQNAVQLTSYYQED